MRILALICAAISLAGLAAGGGSSVDRIIKDPAIVENSGLAVSPRHSGILWTVNDSGNPPVLFAVGKDGRTVARLTLTGVPNVDWEAVAAWRDSTGRALLAVADIGDNAGTRKEIEVDVVGEPAILRPQTLKPLRRLRLTYPGGATDAEALLVDPLTQRMYIATKGFASQIYAVPSKVLPGEPGVAAVDAGRLELVGAVSAVLVTDGAVLPTGQVLLRTYTSLLVLPSLHGTGSGLRPLLTSALPKQRQGEGIAVDPDHPGAVLLSSEGVSQPVLRLDVSGLAGLLRPTRPPSSSPRSAVRPSSTSTTPSTPNAAVTSGDPPSGGPSFLTLLSGAALVVGAGLGVTAFLRRRGAS